MLDNSLKYIEWVRENYKQCVVSGRRAEHLHHLRTVGMGNNRTQPNPNHFTVVPLSAEVHNDIHKLGKAEFRSKWGFPGEDIFVSLWQWVQKANIEYFYGEDNAI